ncbi:MAG: glycosyltransferase family 9 protein [Burkholderiales bacterium]|nr:glycosyltransferase family 9 protein [Burkholderiales bacterium]
MRRERAPAGDVRRILVVKLSSFGDIVLATGAIAALRRAHPNADLRVVVERRWAPLLAACPEVDGLIEASGRVPLTASHVIEIAHALAGERRRRGRFDLAIDLQGTRRSAAWTYLSGARTMAGRGSPRPGWRYAAPHDHGRHAVTAHAGVCAALGIDTSDVAPRLTTAPSDEARLDALLDGQRLPRRGHVLLNPYSRWASKSWNDPAVVELAGEIARLRGEPVIVTGGPEDTARAMHVAASCGGAAVSLAGRLSLGESLALTRRASLMVSCDSGPMHAAAAFGVPVVALFGPTLPEHTGPWGRGHTVIQPRRPPDHHAYRRRDGVGYLDAIAPQAVFDAVRETFRRAPGGTPVPA